MSVFQDNAQGPTGSWHVRYPGLRGDPFPNPPSPDFFFESSVHSGAWTFLRQALASEEPFVLLSGEYGMGKTLLCLKLARTLEEEAVPYVHLSTPTQGVRDLLRRAHEVLGSQPGPGASESLETLVEGLYDHFRENSATSQRLFLLVEDPQDFDASDLHRLRMLPNFNLNGWYPLSLVLFAHTSFDRMLREPSWEPLHQRLKMRYRLQHLSQAETREYIYYRLFQWRSEEVTLFAPYFSEAAVERIHALSGGIPRAINNLCGTCLMLGSAREVVALDASVVDAAAEHLGWVEARPAGPAPGSAPAREAAPDPVAAGAPEPRAAAAPRTEQMTEEPAQPENPVGLDGAPAKSQGGSPATWAWWAVTGLFLVLIVLVLIARSYGI